MESIMTCSNLYDWNFLCGFIPVFCDVNFLEKVSAVNLGSCATSEKICKDESYVFVLG